MATPCRTAGRTIPSLESAWTGAGTTTVRGTLDTPLPATVELLQLDRVRPERFRRRARRSLSASTCPAPGRSSARSPRSPTARSITALATTADGTSEFSPCVRTGPAPPPAPTRPAPAPARDTAAPVLSGLRVTPSRFKVGSSTSALAARRTKRGTFIRYSLSEPATYTHALTQSFRGRRKNGRCVPATKALRKRACCRGTATAGTLPRAAGR